MDKTEARTLATDLMRTHGLLDSGWTFAFDRAKTRAGACHYSKRKITMSESYVSLNNKSSIVNTILHEIAHALAGYEAAHGWEWKRVARSIGCDAKRCVTVAVTQERARYEARCDGNGAPHVAAQYHRRPGVRMLSGATCRTHKKVVKWVDTMLNLEITSGIFAPVTTTSTSTREGTKYTRTTTSAWVAGSSDWDKMFGDA